MKGKVAVVSRGMVPFFDKVQRALETGAVGIIVINGEDLPYKCTAPGTDCSAITGQVVCVGHGDCAQLTNSTRVSITGVAKNVGKVVVVEEGTSVTGGGAAVTGGGTEVAGGEGNAGGAAEASLNEDAGSSEVVKKTAAGKKKSA